MGITGPEMAERRVIQPYNTRRLTVSRFLVSLAYRKTQGCPAAALESMTALASSTSSNHIKAPMIPVQYLNVAHHSSLLFRLILIMHTFRRYAQ